MRYSDTINNVQFESYYDKENKILHVLDEMKMSLEPKKSVTNGIDEVIPMLEKEFNLTERYRLFLYGTDNVITEYIPTQRKFMFISERDPLVDKESLEKMFILYRDEAIEKSKKASVKEIINTIESYGYTTQILVVDSSYQELIISKDDYCHVKFRLDGIITIPIFHILNYVECEIKLLQEGN